MNDGPNKVVQSSREIIEHKLLVALDDPATVAILASKDDLDLLIFCLSKIAAGQYVADSHWTLRAPEEIVRDLLARDYLKSLKQLRREAFGE